MLQDKNTIEISKDELAHLGEGQVGYVRKVTSDELIERFPGAVELQSGLDLWALFAADGTPIMRMTDCEVVSIDEAFDENVPAEPGSGQTIPIGALYDTITGGVGTKVSVIGYYHGSGHSSANDLTAVNLSSGAGEETVVNCHMQGKDVVPANLADNREGVEMAGTIGQPGWDIVNLYDCTFVNR